MARHKSSRWTRYLLLLLVPGMTSLALVRALPPAQILELLVTLRPIRYWTWQLGRRPYWALSMLLPCFHISPTIMCWAQCSLHPAAHMTRPLPRQLVWPLAKLVTRPWASPQAQPLVPLPAALPLTPSALAYHLVG